MPTNESKKEPSGYLNLEEVFNFPFLDVKMKVKSNKKVNSKIREFKELKMKTYTNPDLYRTSTENSSIRQTYSDGSMSFEENID